MADLQDYLTGDLYVLCPRCKGRRDVFVITREGTPWLPSLGEYVGCPLCHQTGEADRDAASAWLCEQAERDL